MGAATRIKFEEASSVVMRLVFVPSIVCLLV